MTPFRLVIGTNVSEEHDDSLSRSANVYIKLLDYKSSQKTTSLRLVWDLPSVHIRSIALNNFNSLSVFQHPPT
jgi:hypothetical protein